MLNHFNAQCRWFCMVLFILIVGLKPCLWATTDDRLVSLLPPTNFLENWQWEESPQMYEPDNLFEYINGSADLYLAYDFKQLATVGFIDPAEMSIVIDIYDMGTPLDAFGVYSVSRSPSNQFEAIGAEAIVSDYHIRFYKNQYVVDLNASDASPEIQQALRKFAKAVAAGIGDDNVELKELRLLPQKDMLPKSLKYIRSGLLGHKFLSRGLEAGFMVNKHEIKAFIAICESEADAAAAYQKYLDYLKQSGKTPLALPELSQPSVTAEIPYHQQGIVTHCGRYVAGAMDLPDAKDGMGLIESILSGVSCGK
ncbi:hypothetical protein JXJ21_04505 [candidate division KSB1 bacterium]|nr:hypothetical protein [candidate division KSB1 bacterium]